ncbi:MAG TPA: GNAT family N-acetyltransferase, partial [Elusimicrobiota bacterium]|nr:GNAT family N-acetyltransferase [Elusimicrobiota bacterium]
DQVRELSMVTGWAQWRAEIEDYIQNHPEDVILQLDEKETVLGYMILDPRERPEGEYLSFISFRPEARGGGLGKAMMREAMRIALARGRGRLIGHVRGGSRQHSFYRKIAADLTLGVTETQEGEYSNGDPKIFITFSTNFATLKDAEPAVAAAWAEQVRELSRTTGWESWLGEIDDYLTRHPEDVIVKLDGDGKVVGYAILDSDYRPEGEYLSFMAIRPDARGGGLGKAILKEALRIAAERGRERLTWHVRGNTQQHHFYERAAAELTDSMTQTVEGQYADTGEPKVFMTYSVKR